MRYPGGKNNGGTWRWIVNQIPPHKQYLEPFLGSGPVLRFKRPAERSYAIDLDPRCIRLVRPKAPKGTLFYRQDGIQFLADFGQSALRACRTREVFAYCDPPYLTRRDPRRRYYRYEMTEADHQRFLEVLLALPRGIMVMVSGYHGPLYDRMLKGWRTDTFRVMTRGGPAVEVLWMNYPEPTELHDDRWIGGDWRGRLDFHRLVQRWTRRFEVLPPVKRAAVLAALSAAARGDGAKAGPPLAAAAAGNGEPAKGGRRRSRSTPGRPTAAVPPGGSAAARGVLDDLDG